MRAIWLNNTTDGSFSAMHAKDAHGQPLTFAPRGHAPVNATAFHDAWIRALLARGTLRTDFEYAARRAPGISAGELAIEAGSNLLELGFSRRDVHKLLGVVPTLLEPVAPTLIEPVVPVIETVGVTLSEPVGEIDAVVETVGEVVGEPLEPVEPVADLFAPPPEEPTEPSTTSTRRRRR